MKRTLSLFLTLVMALSILTSVPLSAGAATTSDLTFLLNADGTGYIVDDCDESVNGTIIVPDTYNGLPVTSIGYRAFENCINLVEIKIPDSVISVAAYAFFNSGCYNDESNWENGVLYIGNHLIEADLSVSGKYRIKSGTRTIANLAFSSHKNLTGIIIPDSMITIGFEAFYDCTSLETVEIPDSVRNIEQEAFYGCTNLTFIKLPDSDELNIGSSAFTCTGYFNDESNWESDVLYIGNHLINAKYNLTGSYTIKQGTKTIGGRAFYPCENLTSVKIPDSVKSIGTAAFFWCLNLVSVDLGNNVKSIGDSVFSNCVSLTSINIPNSVISIGETAFIWCNSLTNITIPNKVRTIGRAAFEGCGSLRAVTIPASVEKIGERAFGYNDSSSKIENFEICGVKGSVAETYAKENDFTFIEIKEPAQPTLKKVSNIDSNVKITWGTVKGADKYYVYRKTGTGSYEYIGSTSKTYFNDKEAGAGKTCRYRIRAKNEAGYSEYSASIAIKHIDEPTLKLIENSTYGVLIKWDKVTGAEKYNVYRKVSGGEYEYIGVTSNAYYTDKTAESGTKHYYAIRAKRDDSISSQSASLSKYYLADPTLNTPSSTSKGVGLRWSEITGAEGYMVYRRTADGSYERITTEKGVSNVTYRDTTAKKGTKYYYKVKAYKSKTYSAYSNTKAITDKY